MEGKEPQGGHILYAGLVVMLMILPGCSFCQDSARYVPDGTEGEMLELLETDTMPQRWRDKRWRLFKGKYSTFKLGGGVLYDFVTYSQDEAGRRQNDSAGYVLEPTFAVRDIRLTFSGRFKTKRGISWKAGIIYDGPTRSWLIRETGVMVEVPELWGNFFAGRTKEGFSLNKVMIGYAGWTMERQMAIDVIPILADGVKWLGYLPKQRILWNAGIYTDWFSEGQGFSTYKWQTAFRIGLLPVYTKDGREVLHVAANYRYGKPLKEEIKLRSRPEVNPAPFFIDTGVFPSEHSTHIGGEAYYRSGPWLFGSEVYTHRFSSVTAGDPVFFGGDAVVSYMITGELRPYHTATGIFGFVPVKRPVFKGGPGAWEVLLKYSTLDLNGGNLQGGKFWKLTSMVNWYLSKELRLELAYGYGVLDRYGLQGVTQFFQSRLQFILL